MNISACSLIQDGARKIALSFLHATHMWFILPDSKVEAVTQALIPAYRAHVIYPARQQSGGRNPGFNSCMPRTCDLSRHIVKMKAVTQAGFSEKQEWPRSQKKWICFLCKRDPGPGLSELELFGPHWFRYAMDLVGLIWKNHAQDGSDMAETQSHPLARVQIPPPPLLQYILLHACKGKRGNWIFSQIL